MFSKINSLLAVAATAVMLVACQADGEYQGTEFAPNMYYSEAYEPLTQIVDFDNAKETGIDTTKYYNSLRFNQSKYPINMLRPVPGTVSRQNFSAVTGSAFISDSTRLLYYDLNKDSLAMAARILNNPVPLDSGGVVLEQGKKLYTNFCSPCHGAEGKGDGKVGGVYKGVANLTARAYAEGHIFHVITHGKGRMWPHKSQINPEERWKIVHYVKSLHKGS